MTCVWAKACPQSKPKTAFGRPHRTPEQKASNIEQGVQGTAKRMAAGSHCSPTPGCGAHPQTLRPTHWIPAKTQALQGDAREGVAEQAGESDKTLRHSLPFASR